MGTFVRVPDTNRSEIMQKLCALAAIALVAVPLSTGAAPKHCPPGHAKKGWCSPGSVYALPPGIRMQIFDRWREAGLRAPRSGQRYVIVDDELFLILEATREVLQALGAVSRVLN